MDFLEFDKDQLILFRTDYKNSTFWTLWIFLSCIQHALRYSSGRFWKDL